MTSVSQAMGEREALRAPILARSTSLRREAAPLGTPHGTRARRRAISMPGVSELRTKLAGFVVGVSFGHTLGRSFAGAGANDDRPVLARMSSEAGNAELAEECFAAPTVADSPTEQEVAKSVKCQATETVAQAEADDALAELAAYLAARALLLAIADVGCAPASAQPDPQASSTTDTGKDESEGDVKDSQEGEGTGDSQGGSCAGWQETRAALTSTVGEVAARVRACGTHALRWVVRELVRLNLVEAIAVVLAALPPSLVIASGLFTDLTRATRNRPMTTQLQAIIRI